MRYMKVLWAEMLKFEDDGFVEAMKETAKKVFEEHPGEVDE